MFLSALFVLLVFLSGLKGERNIEELDIPYYCSLLKAICLCQELVCKRY